MECGLLRNVLAYNVVRVNKLEQNKNIFRPFWGSNHEKNKNTEAQPKLHGSYKKRVYIIYIFCYLYVGFFSEGEGTLLEEGGY